MTADPSWEAVVDGSIPTPHLALRQATLVANVESMARNIEALGGVGTPHLKTHKSLEIARMQLAAGARAATVATLAEAELSIAAGFERVLVAYPPVPRTRVDALARLTELAQVDVVCNSVDQVAAVASTGAPLGIYWEVDCGTRRLGTRPGPETASRIQEADFGNRARLAGLMTFAGYAYSASDDSELVSARQAQDDALADSVAALDATAGALELSVGTTPLARFESGIASEYRYGNYVFNDATQVMLGGAALDDCALAVITTVLDVPSHTRVVVDAGSKSLPAETMSPRTRGYGIVANHPDVCLDKLYEEHGLAESRRPHQLRVGDRLAIIPNHACTCANSHDEYVIYADGSPVDVWPVRARRAYRDVVRAV